MADGTERELAPWRHRPSFLRGLNTRPVLPRSCGQASRLVFVLQQKIYEIHEHLFGDVKKRKYKENPAIRSRTSTPSR